ncbi:histidine phosphatase family protein [Pirellulaceae bacterium]|nr:histidine phosphatase family protein [Pirellulaceae bacterium]
MRGAQIIYLVRHAQSANNAQDESKRVCDPSITAVGQRQAVHLAKRLADIAFETLLTSPFRRALQTTKAVQLSTGHLPELLVDLHENGGCYEGWKPDNFEGRNGFHDEEIRREIGKINIVTPVGPLGWWKSQPRESVPQSTTRAIKLENYLKTRLVEKNKSIVCISHADFISSLLKQMFGQKIQEQSEFHLLKNTGVTSVKWASNSWQLIELNSVSHLVENLVTQ